MILTYTIQKLLMKRYRINSPLKWHNICNTVRFYEIFRAICIYACMHSCVYVCECACVCTVFMLQNYSTVTRNGRKYLALTHSLVRIEIYLFTLIRNL